MTDAEPNDSTARTLAPRSAKSVRFELRLLPDEKRKLGNMAKRLGKTEAEVMRSLLRRGFFELYPVPRLPIDPGPSEE